MRTTLTAALLAWPLALPSPAAAAGDPPPAPAVECSPRAGLPNFFAKLTTTGEVRLAYLGGSITAQEGWRPKTLAHVQKAYPDARVSQINAAIGGTGSDLGVFRLRQDVLDHRPDLLFVEFAVNDGGRPPHQIHQGMEGIVRQTWRAFPACDICFVYTLVDGFAPDLQAGRFPPAAAAMEQVAAHYGIPSIHLGLEVARMAGDGRLVFKGPKPKAGQERKAGEPLVFSDDGVHPFPETGHELYLQAIARSLPAIRAAGKAAAPHTLPAPFIPDHYERAKMIPIDRAALSAGFAPSADLTRRFGARLPALRRADKPGESVRFTFQGTYAAVYDVIGPDCGQVAVTVDGQPPVIRPRFDSYCTYPRLATLGVASGLADTTHTVRLEIAPGQPDKAAILAQRKQTIDDPKRYDGTAFLPGALLLVGDLIEP